MNRPWHYLLLLLTTLGCYAGCETGTSSDPKNLSLVETQDNSANLQEALQLLENMDRSRVQDLNSQVVFSMNRWLQGLPKNDDWKPSSLLQRLPRRLKNMPEISAAALAEEKFNNADVGHLIEARWFRKLGNWVGQQPPPKHLVKWARQAELPEDIQEQVLVAERLFDWSVRNIQLRPLLTHPDLGRVGPTAGNGAANRTSASLAIPGPGYTQSPMETLLYGRDDALGRSRVFILTARQQGLPVVMLGVSDPKGTGAIVPWTTALLAGGELYLFDSQLGLPIPDKSGQGIATLAQVQADPSLVRNLDMSQELTYGVSEKQLKDVYAMVDATPEFLSWRMHVLQQNLAGANDLVVAVESEQLKVELKEISGINDVRLWATPLESIQFRNVVHANRGVDPRVTQLLRQRAFILGVLPALQQARVQQVGGVFSDGQGSLTEREFVGAKSLMLRYQMSPAAIEICDQNRDLLVAHNMQRQPNEDDARYNDRMRVFKTALREAKQATSLWLALIHFETENYDACRRWLDERILSANPASPWEHLARYNLGRSLEELGDYQEAQRMYRTDTSPQKHGSLLRARMLRQRTETQTEDEAEATKNTATDTTDS